MEWQKGWGMGGDYPWGFTVLVIQPSFRAGLNTHEIANFKTAQLIQASLIFGFFKYLPFHVCLANSSETWLCY